MGTAREGDRPHEEGMLRIGTKENAGPQGQGALGSDHTEGWEASEKSRVVRAEGGGKRDWGVPRQPGGGLGSDYRELEWYWTKQQAIDTYYSLDNKCPSKTHRSKACFHSCSVQPGEVTGSWRLSPHQEID